MENKFKLVALAAILIFISCSSNTEEQISSSSSGNSGEASLRIKNESGLALKDVIWNGTNFGDIQNSDFSEEYVSAGSGKLSFNIADKNIDARTQYIIQVDRGSSEEFTFTANTIVEELNDINLSNVTTLSQLKKTEPPKTGSISVSDLTKTSARLSSSITNVGNPEYTEKGFCYSTALGSVEQSSNCTEIDGEFTMNLEEKLTEGIRYYAKTYISNDMHPKQYSEAFEFITRSPSLVLGCWLDESDPNEDEICFQNGVGTNDWYYYGTDYEGYEFAYLATDTTIEITVTGVYWTENGYPYKSNDLDDLEYLTIYIPINEVLSYSVSADGNTLSILQWSRNYTKQ